MLKRFGLAVMTLALVAALAGGAAAQQSLTWTAGAVGGGWYTISGGMAELLREKARAPVVLDLGVAHLHLGLLEIGLALLHLQLERRRVELGQELSLRHRRVEINVDPRNDAGDLASHLNGGDRRDRAGRGDRLADGPLVHDLRAVFRPGSLRVSLVVDGVRPGCGGEDDHDNNDAASVHGPSWFQNTLHSAKELSLMPWTSAHSFWDWWSAP